MANQRKAFGADPGLQRDAVYFRDKIGRINSAEELVADRRLLGTALAAFGLEGDINNKAFLQKILQDGTLRPEALGNRLADKRYLEFSKTFGFGDFPVPNTKKSDFADRILSAFEARRFEVAVGQQNGDMRLALNAQRELGQIARRNLSLDGKWYSVMGSPPLRTVMQTALGLPASVAAIDIDKQLGIFKARAERMFGSADLGQFSDPDRIEKLVRQFLVRSESQSGAVSPALTLMRNAGRPAALLSRYV